METRYKILVNECGQYSLWPIRRPNAMGWLDTGITGPKDSCIEQVSSLWSDATLRQQSVQPPRRGEDLQNDESSGTHSPGIPAQLQMQMLALYGAMPNLRSDVGFVFQIDGPLDLPAFAAAVRDVAERYAALAATLGGDQQSCVSFVEQPMSAVSNQDILEAINDRTHTAARGALLSVQILHLPDSVYAVAFVGDGMVFDQDSAHAFCRQVSQVYRSSINQATSTSHVVAAAPSAEPERVTQAATLFWRNQLQDIPAALQLPTRRSIPVARHYNYLHFDFTLSPTLTAQLLQLADRADISLHSITLAALQALLYRYTGAERFIVSTPYSLHAHGPAARVIGNFTGLLPVVTNLNDDAVFLDVARKTEQFLQEAREHVLAPLQEMTQATGLGLVDGYQRLCQVMFDLRDDLRDSLRIQDCDVQVLMPPRITSGAADLRLELTRAGNSIRGCMSYQPDLFDETRIATLASHYETLLTSAVSCPEAKISAMDMLSATEHRQQITGWNCTTTVYPKHRCIHQLYENQARTMAHRVAVRCGAETLNYAQLNTSANRLARYLRARGVVPNAFVAVYMRRSIDMVISLLAILKAGGTYVPLDPAYPQERLEYMLLDTSASLLLTTSDMAQALPKVPTEVICLDAAAPEIETHSGENLENINRASDLAYVIYTSGSTGKPKGIMVPHLGVVRLVKNTNYLTIDPDDVFLQFSPVSFDASVLEIWGPLLNGASLFLPPTYSVPLAELAGIIRDQRISTVILIAPLFHAMVEMHLEALKEVKYLFAVGDTLSVPHVKRALSFLRRTTLINGYGPSENTTFTTCHHIVESDTESSAIPIGKPIANTTVYILDRALNPVPAGVIGELYTGGDGLADGYLKRLDLTVQSFIADPFCEEPGSRIYKSGDLARYAADGTIEFLGRIDHQVKIRGIRIELGEVESALASHPQLGEVVVVARDDRTGHKYLAAYAVKRVQTVLTSQDVLTYLRDRLPPHLLPDAIVLLKEFRLTPNGKIDRKVLPAPREVEFVNSRFVYGVTEEKSEGGHEHKLTFV